jgi:hypothetical protein
MKYHLATVSYFMAWGLLYGFLLGAFSGTAILPYFGTMYATMWGIGIGLGSGALSGIVAEFIRARSFHEDTDLDRFRRMMSLVIGALIAIAAPIMLVTTTNGFLWGSGMLRDMLPWTALSIFSASFWGGLSSAYIASHYPTYMARMTLGRDYDFQVDQPNAKQEVWTAFRTLLRKGLNRWVFLLGAIAGVLLNTLNGVNYVSYGAIRSFGVGEVLAYAGIGGVLGVIATFFIGLYVAFGTSSLITFLKRLIFREYFSHMPPQWTRWILTLTAFVFTGAVTYWSMIFAPLIAFVVALTVYRTLALPDETIDKAKRKEKNALALAEETDLEDEEGDLLLDEDEVVEERLQR